jgi:hypothetical protein
VNDLLSQLIERAERSGDRIDVPRTTLLAAEAIRLARVATSIHLAQSFRRPDCPFDDRALGSADADRSMSAARESVA